MNHIFIGKNIFIKFHCIFRIYADFEANNIIDNSSFGYKTTNIYHQKPVCNGYYIVSELNDVLKSGYYHSPLGYENVDWFVNEMIKLENKMNFYFKNTKKDIVMSKEDEEEFKIIIFVIFVKKKLLDDKVRDHCHLTGNIEDQLIIIAILMLNRNKVILFQFYFIILVIMIVICFLKL